MSAAAAKGFRQTEMPHTASALNTNIGLHIVRYIGLYKVNCS